MIIDCSAPGKLLLLGEYAVLFGHPAVVMAVDRRARVRLGTPPSDRSTVAAPGLASQPQELTVAADGTVQWQDPVRALPLVEGVVGALVRDGLIPPPPPFAAELDTRLFYDSGKTGRSKLGLGSSAALTVALAAALVEWSGSRPPAPVMEWLQALVRLHRSAHGGRGSGVDVAASLLGGVLEYRLGARGEVVTAEPTVLPEELRLIFVWTGRSADTSDFLSRLEGAQGRRGAEVDTAVARLGTVSGAAVEAIRRGLSNALLEAIDAFWDGLEELGRAADLPILSDEHRQAHRIARGAGASYKPSGAGGGDLGLALAVDPEIAAEATTSLQQAGFRVLGLAVEPSGLELRPRDEGRDGPRGGGPDNGSFGIP